MSPRSSPGIGIGIGSAQRVVSVFIAIAFPQDTAEAASTQWRTVADRITPKVLKLAKLMDDAEHDVLDYVSFPKEHQTKLHSTNLIERLNSEIKRCADVVGPRAFLRTDSSHALGPQR